MRASSLLELSKPKFLSLSHIQKHRKCAAFLRLLYEEAEHKTMQSLWGKYLEYAEWLDLPSAGEMNLETLSDRYHYHLQEAKMKHKEHRLLPCVRKGDQKSAAPTWPIAIYFDNIRSAHNVGSMLRTMEAFSLGKAYFSKSTPLPTHKQVQDTAMGSIQWIEWQDNIPLTNLPRPIVALETAKEATSIFDFHFPEKFTLVAGNEEYGCSASTLKQADFIIEIPLRGHKNSLNVANAFAIASAEIYRQRCVTNSQGIQ